MQVLLPTMRLCWEHLSSQDSLCLQAALTGVDGYADQAKASHNYAEMNDNDNENENSYIQVEKTSQKKVTEIKLKISKKWFNCKIM